VVFVPVRLREAVSTIFYGRAWERRLSARRKVYKRLKTRQRENESFRDLVDRLVEERRTDWREGFGTLSDGTAEDLEDAASASR